MKLNQTLGQLFFSYMSHNLYDLLIYRFVAPIIWGCKTEKIIDNYHRNLSDNHLEIGVGTGYLLNYSNPNPLNLTLSLMDLNKRCLEKSATRLSKYSPATYQRNILQPLSLPGKRFSSIGLNFVMHCVPGSYLDKGVAFQHAYDVLENGGVFFGSTVLRHSVSHKPFSKAAMRILNSLNIFHNDQDDLVDFKQAIESLFDLVEIQTYGPTIVWTARKK